MKETFEANLSDAQKEETHVFVFVSCERLCVRVCVCVRDQRVVRRALRHVQRVRVCVCVCLLNPSYLACEYG